MALFRRPIDRPMMLASLGLAAGLTMIVLAAVTATTGKAELNLPSEIELVYPKDRDTILRQEGIVVDMIPGYTGRLEIDGLQIPTDEVATSANPVPGSQVGEIFNVKFDPGNNKLTYQPRVGAPIEKFDVGNHDLLVIYWRIDQGPERAFSYRSTFKVTL
jgi:hypothetical protein